VEHAQGGWSYSPDAWRWEGLRARCLRETSRILRRREDAEEAAQDALLRVWRQRHQCRQGATPEPWVAQIARREALRLLERRREQEARTVTDGEHVLAGLSDARAGHSAQLDALQFDEAVANLPNRDRALAVLHYRGDLAQGCLATALGVPEGTVRVRLHRLRARLRASLIEDDERTHG